MPWHCPTVGLCAVHWESIMQDARLAEGWKCQGKGDVRAGVIQQHEAAPEDAAEDVPLWLSMLQETAAQAQSCEAELGELVLGAGALLVIEAPSVQKNAQESYAHLACAS